jgi:hypothetical protein
MSARADNFHHNGAFFQERKEDEVFHEAFNQTLFTCPQHPTASENRSSENRSVQNRVKFHSSSLTGGHKKKFRRKGLRTSTDDSAK